MTLLSSEDDPLKMMLKTLNEGLDPNTATDWVEYHKTKDDVLAGGSQQLSNAIGVVKTTTNLLQGYLHDSESFSFWPKNLGEKSFAQGPNFVDNGETPELPEIKYPYNSSAIGGIDETGSYFKIGPHVYGGEVQSIKIVENKAVKSFQGARGSSDFLVDSGLGDADAMVTMFFSGTDHIKRGLIPLVALFRMSPITTVRNNVINAALYDDFVEDNAEGMRDIVKNNLEDLIDEVETSSKTKKFFEALGQHGNNRSLDEATFIQLKKEHANNPIFSVYPTYESFEKNLSSFLDDGQDAAFQNSDSIEAEAILRTRKQRLDYKKDLTGNVPMAFVGLKCQTHPEFPESLIVNVFLKRIHIENYLRDGLRYRTSKNTSTPDAENAYWLRRGLDLYIDNYISPAWVETGAAGQDFGDVVMRFGGDDIILSLFKKEHGLEEINVNDGKDGVVTQLGLSIENKFAFHRLQGKSYPTAQYMGSKSAEINVSIRTSDPAKFKQIHAYKNAADFFARTADRKDRFNGWTVDSFITRLSNNIELPDTKLTAPGYKPSSWYPLVVVSETNDDAPELRDITITFKETNPNFFEDMGFSVRRTGHSLVNFRQFFMELYERGSRFREVLAESGYIEATANPSKQYLLDNYSWSVIYGYGSPREKFAVINPDTLVAAMFQKYTYKDGKLEFNTELSDIQNNILDFLANDEKFSGILKSGDISVVDELSKISTFATDITIPIEYAEDLLDKFFIVDDGFTQTRTLLLKKLQHIPEEDGRKDLYSFVSDHLEVSFTDEFAERLFAALVKREQSPIGPRLYDVSFLVNAYNSLSLAMEAKSHDILDEDFANALSKSKLDEKKVFVDGADFKSRSQAASSYPDYPFISYENLFDVNGLFPGNWLRYSPTFQSMGIMNNDPEFFKDGFTSSAVDRAQSQPLATAKSPVAPFVWFYHETEFDKIREHMDEEQSEWFNKVKQLRLDLPFDVEEILEDLQSPGTFSGVRQNTAGVPAESIGLATRVENMIDKTISRLDRDIVNKAAQDIVMHMAKEQADKYHHSDVHDLTDGEVKNFKDEFRSLIDGKSRKNSKFNVSDVSVPFLVGTYMGSDVVNWQPLTGVFGEKVVRSLIASSEADNLGLDDFIDQTLTRSEAGFTDGLTISCAHEDENRVSMLKVTQSFADNMSTMSKAFPAMRLYFIDFVGPRIVVQDNFYGYHAVNSIDITLDKHDADLAVITLADPFHILQGSQFGTEAYNDNNNAIDDVVLPASVEDINAENIMSRIKLKQGRAIQIRGGYSSDPDNLDILFTGKIAEIKFGDVVTIVAQGWKAELISRQVNFELRGKTESSVKDLVVNAVRQANPAGIGEQYSRNEAQRLFELSSSLPAVEQSIWNSLVSGTGTASPFGSVAYSAGYGGVDPLGFGVLKQIGVGLDMRLKNIWAPDQDRARWNYLADISTTGWQGRGWIVPLKTAWEVLEEASNYIWGYVPQVIPYDGEATLFFGRPEQMYFYTAGNNHAQRKWNETRATSIADIKRSWGVVLTEFFDSREYYVPVMRFNTFSGVGSIKPKNNAGFLFADIEVKPGFLPPRNFEHTPSHSPTLLSSATIQASQISLTLHADIHKHFRGAPDNEFRKFMLNNSFMHSFESISQLLGSKQTAAINLLSSFYGLSPSALSNRLDSVYVCTELLKKGGSDTSGLKQLLDQIALRYQDEQDAIDSLDFTSITEDYAKTALEALGEAAAIDALSDRSLIKSLELTEGGPNERFLRTGESVLRINYKSAIETGTQNIYGSTTSNVSRHHKPAFDAIFTYLNKVEGLKYDVTEVGPFQQNLQVKAIIKGPTSRLQNLHAQLSESGFKTVIPKVIAGYKKVVGSLSASESLRAKNSIVDENAESIAKKLGLPAVSPKGLDLYEGLDHLGPVFRSYVYHLARFMTKAAVGASDLEETRDAMRSIRDNKVFDHRAALNMKVFRDYHYIRDGVDILENNISASTREMHNAVVVRYAHEIETSNNKIGFFKRHFGSDNFDNTIIGSETEWATWPNPSEHGHIGMQFDANVSLKDKKVAVYTDLNCSRRDQCALVATNVLTKLMRPMYRNNLKIIGRPIKPWDQVYLKDDYVDMYGPIDVERVVHHYSPETGWCTNIVPHLVAEANPNNRYVQAAIFNNRVDKINNIVDYAQWALVLSTLLPVGGAAFAAGAVTRKFLLKNVINGAAKLGVKRAAKANVAGNVTRASVAEQFKVVGRSVAAQAPSTLRSMTYTFGVGDMAQTVLSRYLVRNQGVGDDILPVIISPIIHKGIPLTAGLEGDEVYYWSMSSRVHYAYKDFLDGVGAIYDAMTSGFVPSSSRTEKVLKQLQIIDMNGKVID